MPIQSSSTVATGAALLSLALIPLLGLTANRNRSSNSAYPALTPQEKAALAFLQQKEELDSTIVALHCTSSLYFQEAGGPVYRKVTCNSDLAGTFVLKEEKDPERGMMFTEVLTAEPVT